MRTESNHSSAPEQESKIDELVSLLAEHRAYWTTAVESLEHIGKTYAALMQEMLHRLTTQRVKMSGGSADDSIVLILHEFCMNYFIAFCLQPTVLFPKFASTNAKQNNTMYDK